MSDPSSHQRLTPTPLHRAIDQVTALKLELRKVQHQLESGQSVDPLLLDAMHHALELVGEALIEYRDQD